jgi:hypothetical protein
MELMDFLDKEQSFCWSKNSKPFIESGRLTVMPSKKSLGRYLGAAASCIHYLKIRYIYPVTFLISFFHLLLGLESSHCPLDFTIKIHKNLSF